MSDMKAHGPKLFVIDWLPEHLTCMKIRPVGDLHFGNPHQNEKIIDDLLYDLKHDPEQYWINAGDMLENNTKDQSHDGVWQDTMTPEEQLETYIDKFLPVTHKLLCAIDGNHDNRTKNKSQVSLMRRAAREMGYFDRYVSDGAYMVLRFGERVQAGRRRARQGRQCQYTGYITHGNSVGTSVSSKASGLEKMSSVANADFYIGAHTHSQIVFRDRYYDFDENSKHQLSYRDRWYINTGSALEYGGYALTARYAPQPPGFPTIILSGDREHIEVVLK